MFFKTKLYKYLPALVACLSLFPLSVNANPSGVPATEYGVNTHFFTSPAYNVNQTTALTNLKNLGVKHIRVGVNLADDTDAALPGQFTQLLNVASSLGIKVTGVIAVPFTWGDNRTDNGKYPAGDAAALYQQGYNRVYNFVSQFGTRVRDWEMQNELNLLVKDANGSPLFGRGWDAADFNTSLMNDWASVLKGMSDAIDTVNTTQGLQLRRVLGTTSSMFGFIDFMISKGVKVDVLGYHYYEHQGVDPYNYWRMNAPTFNLFAKFATYNIPVFVNEFNCAEIYDSNYVNTAGSATMNTCNANLNTMLATFTNQTVANIELIEVYELFDQTAFGPSNPESRFGLMFDINNAKPMMTTLSNYALVGPDLIITNFTMTPAIPFAGDQVVFSVTIKNQGNVATPTINHGIGFIVDNAGVAWSSNPPSTLAPGQSVTLTANGGPSGSNKWVATAGTHTIKAIVDDVNRIPEINESNNTYTQSLTVAPSGPDLIVTSFTMSPASPLAGNQVLFTAVIKNQGNVATPTITHGVGFAVDGQTVTWYSSSITMAPGQSVTATAVGGVTSSKWTATSGTHVLRAWVDDVNRITESNENNNTMILNLVVP